jgi:hypothetical protein
VELFIDPVRVINTRAERRVEREQIAEFRRVADKENVLCRLAGVSMAHPDGVVREVVYPAVGEVTLKNLVAEARATESRRRQRVRTVLASSYSHHYRMMLPKLLDALEFRCKQHGVPTGDGCRGAAAPVQGPRWPAHTLRARRPRPAGRGGQGGLAAGGRR